MCAPYIIFFIEHYKKTQIKKKRERRRHHTFTLKTPNNKNFNKKFNKSTSDLMSKYNISLTRTRPQIGGFYNPNTDLDRDKVKVVHLAHKNISIIKNNNPIYKDIHPDQLRIDMVKKLLNLK